MEEQQMEEGEVSVDDTSPEKVLEQLFRLDEQAKEQENESILPSQLKVKRLFIFDELLNPVILRRYLEKPHMEMIAKLPRYKLVFPKFFPPRRTGLASIQRTGNPDDIVWGITVDVTHQDLSRLNRYKGTPNRYHMRTIWVRDRGDLRYPVLCYVISVPDEKPSKPSKELIDDIITGAKARGLPEEYIEWLSSIETL